MAKLEETRRTDISRTWHDLTFQEDVLSSWSNLLNVWSRQIQEIIPRMKVGRIVDEVGGKLISVALRRQVWTLWHHNIATHNGFYVLFIFFIYTCIHSTCFREKLAKVWPWGAFRNAKFMWFVNRPDNVVVECHGHTIAADILKPDQVFLQGSRLRRCLSRVECTTFGGDLNSCDEP